MLRGFGTVFAVCGLEADAKEPHNFSDLTSMLGRACGLVALCFGCGGRNSSAKSLITSSSRRLVFLSGLSGKRCREICLGSRSVMPYQGPSALMGSSDTIWWRRFASASGQAEMWPVIHFAKPHGVSAGMLGRLDLGSLGMR